MSTAKQAPGPLAEAWAAIREARRWLTTDRREARTNALVALNAVNDDSGRADALAASAAQELLAVAQEAVRIEHARLVLADGIGDDGKPYTEAQKLDARAFLSRRRADWFHEAVAAIAKATGEQQ